MTPYKVSEKPPAKRLVLVVADGLRADRLFEPYKNSTNPNQDSLAPYLKSLIESRASYGVSHTQVPTESRPGHVAIIAGFYEDVSAVTKGWKTNPVEFDSVFNESSHTWSFGSPDILPMFAEGASDKNKVDTVMYPKEYEDFAQEASHLDEFVFLKIQELFRNATTDSKLDSKLRKDGVVFFLHLLGLDTNGHAFKPDSKEYLNNIVYMDDIVRQTVDIVENFYNNDNSTSYILTSDHGMADQGIHGDGNPDNTRTPLIAWGAGISKSDKSSSGDIAKGHDDFSSSWDINKYERKDVSQADIAPLMSSLIGLPFPVNSVGHLPLSYLNNTDDFKANALFVNAKQILEQFLVKENEKRKTRLNFTPFSSLSEPRNLPSDRLSRARYQIITRDYSGAMDTCNEAIKLGLMGLKYYQKYDWAFLRSIITAGYLGWVSFSFIFIFKNYIKLNSNTESAKPKVDTVALSTITSNESNTSNDTDKLGEFEYSEWGFPQYLFLGALIAGSIFFLYSQSAPGIYYAYVGFPVFFWTETLRSLPSILNVIKNSKLLEKDHVSNVVVIFLSLISLEALVYGYHNRIAYSLIMIFLSIGWVFIIPMSVLRPNIFIISGWIFFCLTTSIFTLLPVEKGEHLITSTIGGLIISAVGVVSVIYSDMFIVPKTESKTKKTQISNEKSLSFFNEFDSSTLCKMLLATQTFFVLLSTLLVYSTSTSLRNRKGLPVVNQFLSWILLTTSSIIPFVHLIPFVGNLFTENQHFLYRLIVIFLAFGTPMVILSISYESLFYCSFFGVLVFWIMLERIIYNSTDSNLFLSQQSFRISDLPGFKHKQIPRDTQPSPSSYGMTSSSKKSSRLRTNIIHMSTDEPISYVDEKHSNKTNDIVVQERSLRYDNLRTAIIFLMLVNLAFFGTGNIASLASFQLESVYRLTTTFEPFLMSLLLIYKIFMPFFIVSSAFAVINMMLELPPFSLFLLALSTTDVMTLNFFFMVRDEGSWLDIGTSISHYCISSLFVLFSIALFVISHALVGKIFIPAFDQRTISPKKSG
ncbi:GPI ethanolamine phosphate transferase 1 [Smittium mucronatum]|uniref:GPI ethanolamine phosphate transferase 1 n=1 Tax=Smittium mucronatum TaxID=133383 RepID=A0A1R0GNA5_9FUNG|nr:GPI ethanolamine phosphate transferase 1 [Smittium mucronatum]